MALKVPCKHLSLTENSYFTENYLVRNHIIERQVICPNSLQSREGKMPGTQ